MVNERADEAAAVFDEGVTDEAEFLRPRLGCVDGGEEGNNLRGEGGLRGLGVFKLPSAVRATPRGSFDALAGAVRCLGLGLDPVDGHLYLFLNKRRRLAKALWFDGPGWCVLAKRLEAGSFQLPPFSEADSLPWVHDLPYGRIVRCSAIAVIPVSLMGHAAAAAASPGGGATRWAQTRR